jgi:signal transduction histidine kinase
LRESIQQQTATADVLRVISRSAFDLQAVLDTLVQSASRVCNGDGAGLAIREGDVYRYVANFAQPDEFCTLLRNQTFAPRRGSMVGRTALEGKVVHVADLTADPEYTFPPAVTVAKVRTCLGVPLLRNGVVIGAFSIGRERVEPFTKRQIELVQALADQAVIAIENARLIAELRQRTDQLDRSVTELQRERNNKLMNLEAMAASIAHEVRQPLASIEINGFAALRLLERMPLELDEVRSALNRMINDSHRASRVFDNIRALFGKVGERYEPIDVNGLIRGVLSIVQEELDDHRITASVRLPEDLPKIIGHKGQLEEVLFNLVRNAIEVMQADKNDHRVLQVSSGLRGGDEIVVAVEDSGPGIDPKHAESIFDAFVTTKSQGMGLGLALCRMIIGRHRGELTASPAHPRGSIFRVVLPIR